MFVIGALDESTLLTAVEAGVCAVVRRSEASAPRLTQAVVSAAAR